MGSVCCCLKQATVIPRVGKKKSATPVSSVEGRPSSHRTKLECLSISDQQSHRAIAKGSEKQSEQGLKSPLQLLPKKSLTPNSPLQPGTPKRMRDIQYPEPNCTITIKTLPPKPKNFTPVSEGLVQLPAKTQLSTPGTSVVGLRSVESFDKLGAKHIKRKNSAKLPAKKDEVALTETRDIRQSRRSRAGSFVSDKSLKVKTSLKSLRPLKKAALVETDKGLEVFNKETIVYKKSTSRSADLEFSKKVMNPTETQVEQPEMRAESSKFLGVGTNNPGIHHQTTLELFASSYWKDNDKDSKRSSRQNLPDSQSNLALKNPRPPSEAELPAKFKNAISLYPDNQNFPTDITQEAGWVRKEQIEKTLEVHTKPENLPGDMVSSSAYTGRFGQPALANSDDQPLQFSVETHGQQNSSSVQNVTFMQNPIGESGGSNDQKDLSHFSFKLHAAD